MTKPTVESVAKELETEFWHQLCKDTELRDDLARWALRFRAQGVREFAERAANVIEDGKHDVAFNDYEYGMDEGTQIAATTLRRLAAEVADGE